MVKVTLLVCVAEEKLFDRDGLKLKHRTLAVAGVCQSRGEGSTLEKFLRSRQGLEMLMVWRHEPPLIVYLVAAAWEHQPVAGPVTCTNVWL